MNVVSSEKNRDRAQIPMGVACLCCIGTWAASIAERAFWLLGNPPQECKNVLEGKEATHWCILAFTSLGAVASVAATCLYCKPTSSVEVWTFRGAGSVNMAPPPKYTNRDCSQIPIAIASVMCFANLAASLSERAFWLLAHPPEGCKDTFKEKEVVHWTILSLAIAGALTSALAIGCYCMRTKEGKRGDTQALLDGGRSSSVNGDGGPSSSVNGDGRVSL